MCHRRQVVARHRPLSAPILAWKAFSARDTPYFGIDISIGRLTSTALTIRTAVGVGETTTTTNDNIIPRRRPDWWDAGAHSQLRDEITQLPIPESWIPFLSSLEFSLFHDSALCRTIPNNIIRPTNSMRTLMRIVGSINKIKVRDINPKTNPIIIWHSTYHTTIVLPWGVAANKIKVWYESAGDGWSGINANIWDQCHLRGHSLVHDEDLFIKTKYQHGRRRAKQLDLIANKNTSNHDS